MLVNLHVLWPCYSHHNLPLDGKQVAGSLALRARTTVVAKRGSPPPTAPGRRSGRRDHPRVGLP